MLEKKTKMLKKKVNSPIFLWNMIPGTYTHKTIHVKFVDQNSCFVNTEQA